jgi:membrane protease YdiL (CAAX protease family)
MPVHSLRGCSREVKGFLFFARTKHIVGPPAEVLYEPRGRDHLLREQQTFWGYEDIGLFFFCTLLLKLLLHSAVRLHLSTQASLAQPTLTIQIFILVFLMASLYAILKLRYRRHVWHALGWTRPRAKYCGIAVLAGGILAIPVVVFVHWANWPAPVIRFWDLVLPGVLLGPALEESFFRGCLLPTLARTTGVPVAMVASALLFAALHKPLTILQWVSLTVTGTAYGWMRASSGSTTAAILMHGTYNLTLSLCEILRA